MATISQLNVSLSLNPANFVRNAAVATHAVAEIGHGAYEAVNGVRSLGTAALETQGKLAGLVQQAKDAAFSLLGVATAAGGMGLSIKLAAEAEATETAVGTLLGAAESANQLMQQIEAFTPQTNFGRSEIESAARSLASYGIVQEQIIPSLRIIGDVAAGVGIPIGQLATFYGKARVEGRIMRIELDQLANMGIPIIETLAHQFGVATSEVRQMASEGVIGFAEFQRALASMTGEGGRFQGMMEAMSNSLSGLFSTLRSTIQAVFREFGAAFVEASGLKDGVRALTGAANAFQPIARAAGTVVGWLASGFVKLAQVVLPIISYFKIFGVILFTTFKALNVFAMFTITRMVLGFFGIRLGAILSSAGILLLRGAYFAAARAAVIFHAISGPRGWLILIGSAAAAAAAVYGLKRAFTSAYDEFAKFIEESFRIEETPALVAEATEQYEKLAAQIDTAVEAIERMNEAMDPVLKAIDDAHFDIETAGMTEAQKELERMRERLRQVNLELGVTQDGGLTRAQEQNLAQLKAMQDQLTILRQQQKIREDMAASQKAADQAGMTAAEKMLDDLIRLGATQQQIAESLPDLQKMHQAELAKEQAKERERELKAIKQRADQMRQNVATPLDQYKKQLADIQQLRSLGAIDNRTALMNLQKANKEFLGAIQQQSQKAIESPTALMAGSAEAELAQNRLQTPFERMTEMQRQQLAEARRANALAQQQLAWWQNNPPQEVSIN